MIGNRKQYDMRDTTKRLSFACEKCGKMAATMQLIRQLSGRPSLVFEGFIGETTAAAIGGKPVDLEMFRQIVRLAQSNLKELHRLDPDLFGFICRICGFAYCKDCWQDIHATFDPEQPIWFEEYRGTCPRGHEQMLQD
jgi:hypothetical protein